MLRVQTRSVAVQLRSCTQAARRRLSNEAGKEAMAMSPQFPVGTNVSILIGVTGLLSGAVGSMVGMGGTFLAFPVLTTLFRMPAQMVVSTSMALVLATSLGGSIAYMRRDPELTKMVKEIDWKNIPTSVGNVHLLTAACIAISSSATLFAGQLVRKRMSGAMINKCFGALLIAMAPTIPLREHLKSLQSKVDTGKRHLDMSTIQESLPQIMRTLGIGACSGVLAGMFGVGGGVINVPALTLFTDMDYQTALGTSLAAMIPVGITGCASGILSGAMRPMVGVPLFAGGFMGAYIGSWMGGHLEDKKLQYGFSAVVAALGVKTIRLAKHMV